MTRTLIAALLLTLPLAAQARDIGGAWKAERGRVALRAAKIGFPDRAAGLTLTKTAEFSRKGEALDNVAQYESSDSAVFATVYVYRTTWPDPALTALATERAIRARFGKDVTLAQAGVVPFAGRTDGMIRQVWTGGVINGQALVSAAAFARVGPWMVKLRASGPADRAAEATAALDALIAGVSIEKDAVVAPVAPARLAAPCPAPDGPAPKLIETKDSLAAAMVGSLFVVAGDGAKKADADATSPVSRDLCERGTLAGSIALLQPAGPQPDRVFAAMNDAGTVIAVEPALMGGGYSIKRYAIGEVAVAGTVDRLPTATQLEGWLRTPNAPQMAIRSRTTVTAEGKTQTNVSTDTLK